MSVRYAASRAAPWAADQNTAARHPSPPRPGAASWRHATRRRRTARRPPHPHQREVAQLPADVLPLPVAEMDYPLAEPIAAALHAAVDRSDTGYSSGSRPVAEAFQGFAAERLGWDVDPARVTCTADVSLGNVEVLRRVTEPATA